MPNLNHSEWRIVSWVEFWHRDQVTKSGRSYFVDHLAPVGDYFRGSPLFGPALCHDVLEDTDVSTEQLAGVIGWQGADIVQVLTRRNDESYADYIVRVSENQQATYIKVVDLLHNLRSDRLARLDEATQYRLLTKYHRALERLVARNGEVIDMITHAAPTVNPTVLLMFLDNREWRSAYQI